MENILLFLDIGIYDPNRVVLLLFILHTLSPSPNRNFRQRAAQLSLLSRSCHICLKPSSYVGYRNGDGEEEDDIALPPSRSRFILSLATRLLSGGRARREDGDGGGDSDDAKEDAGCSAARLAAPSFPSKPAAKENTSRREAGLSSATLYIST